MPLKPAAPRRPAFGGPFVFQWHVTDRCPARCRHCYRAETPRRDLGEAEQRQVLEAIHAWLRSRRLPGRLHLAGGEPLQHPDLAGLAEKAASLGLPYRLLTGGDGVTPSLAGALARTGCVGVQVSVEGSEATHDQLRGEGGFRRALAGAAALRGAGLPVTLAMTLHRANLGDLETVGRLAEERADRVYFSRLVPLGRGAGLGGLLGATEWGRAQRRILALAGTLRVPVALRDPTFRPFFAAPWHARRSPVVAGCAAGYAALTIEADGTLMPCRRLALPVGHALDGGLGRALAEDPLCAALRDRDGLQGRCGRCAYRWVCGGCRAVPRSLSGEALGEDPQCPWAHSPLFRARILARHLSRRVRSSRFSCSLFSTTSL